MSTFPLDAAFVLAGGAGKRLWPWSGPDLPKPLLPLGGGGRTLLAATLDRLEGLVAPGGVRLLAPASLAPRLAAAEPRAAGLEIWHEPSPRDTGPAIALAMRRLLEAAPDAVAAVLPADHRVEELGRFRAALSA
ncbi:MAG: mannose-1-phosphate guanylyltransferase, partial [Acidobacteria bacterium]